MQTTALRPKRRYTLYTAGIAAAMMLAVYIMMGIWPFGDGSIVTGDLGGLYLNYFGHLKRALSGSAGFAYGFDKGMGGSLLGLYAYYYSSPFNFIYCLFSLRWFPVAASLVLFAKTVLACVFFRVYIAAKFPQLGWRSVPLALCYGFLAYGFAYAQNIMWHDVVLLLPLICLGIDRIVAGKSLTLYTAVLAVAIFANFYIAYMACIFAVLYFFYSMLTRPAAGATIAAPARKSRWAEWKLPLLRFAGGSLLGGGLTAALLVPALVNINRNKGDLLSFSFSFETNFPLSRLPERFVWGSFAPTDVEGHLPFVYCGLLVLVLVGAYFFSRSISLKEKLLGGGMLLLFLLSFWVKGLDLVWHGLKEPIWFPARYSYLFCFFLVLLAVKALAAKAAGRRAVLLGGGLIFVVLLAMTAFPIAISRSRIALSAAAVLFYSFCLVLAATATSLRRRRVVYGVLIAAVAVELAMNGYFISSGFDSYTLSSHQGRVDANVATLEAIEAADGADDYRIATTHYHSLNDAMLLGYNGLSHFGSTQDGYAQSVLYNLGLRSYGGGGPYLNGGTAFADSVAGLRYLSSDGSLPVAAHWAETGLETPYTVYRNPYVFPMVFMVDGDKLTDTRNGGYQQDLFAYQNDLYTELGGAGTLFEDGGEVKLVDADKNSHPPVGEVPSGGVYRLTAQRDGQHYVWFESGIQLLAPTVDGVERNLYFSPYNSGAIDLGWLAAGQTVEVTFGNTAAFEVTDLRFVWMDTDGLAALSEAVNANGGSFTVRDGRVGGSITAEDDHRWLFTSIPWDPDWQATVNGKPVETRMVAGGLIALPLEAGENIVELNFVPGGSAAGWAITAVCAAAFAALLIWGGLRRRKTRRAAQPAGDHPEEAQASDGHTENATTDKTKAGEG